MPDRTQSAEIPTAAIPITVVTGFLGAGKTTLLNRALRDPAFAGTAVLVNEFGEIGLDHLLVEAVGDDTVLLAAGCLCCTIKGDLVRALKTLLPRIARREIVRVVIETTGLARPAPILQSLQSDPLVATAFALDGVVTLADACHVAGQLEQQPECVEQIAVADLIVLSKCDLASAGAVADARSQIAAINPGAPVVLADIAPSLLLNLGHAAPLDVRRESIAAWLGAEAHDHAELGHHHHRHDPNRHSDRIATFAVIFHRPLHWQGVGSCLEMLIATRGESLLRVKGVLNLVGQDRPVAIHGVQHMFHAPVLLAAWPPGDDRHSRIVFITRDLPRHVVEDGLRAFEGAASSMVA